MNREQRRQRARVVRRAGALTAAPTSDCVGLGRDPLGAVVRGPAIDVPATLAAALQQHQAGRLAEAETLYGRILRAQPDQPDALHLLGVLAHQSGRHAAAVELIGRAVAHNPNAAGYHSNLGVALQALGRLDEAVIALRRATTLDREHADARYNLAVSLQTLGNLDEAVAHYQQVVARVPAHALAHYNLGNALQALGRSEEAETAYRCALALDPAHAPAHGGLGMALSSLGRLDEAVASFEAALALAPDTVRAHLNLGAALQRLGRLDAAAERFRRALTLAPDCVEAHQGLGLVLQELGQVDESLGCFRRALDLDPDHADALVGLGAGLHNVGRSGEALAFLERAVELAPEHVRGLSDLGLVLESLGRADEALDAGRRALALRPDNASVLRNLGDLHRAAGHPREATDYLQRALALEPDSSETHHSIAVLRQLSGDLDGALASFQRALDVDPGFVKAHANMIFVQDLHPQTTLADAHAERRRFQAMHAAPLAARIRPHRNDLDPERRLRVGYVSGDFRRHSAAHAFLPVLPRHDPAVVEVTCYSQSGVEDELTARFRTAAARWRKTLGMSDEAVADLIRDDEIDVLVDLSGFSAGNRLLVFARKPAPVQVTAWGYATGTGLDAIDYFLADRVSVPPEHRQHYAEEIVDLPSILGYEAPTDVPDVAPAPASARGFVTFGSFNRWSKLTLGALDTWARIVAAVPSSRMVLKAGGLDSPENVAKIHQIFGAHGIDPSRIDVLGATGQREHLEAHGLVDVAFDPFPQGGGITTLEALLMGVPTVTLLGERIPGRISGSFLSAFGLDDLVAGSRDAYVAAAVALAGDVPRLARLRGELRDQLMASPLGNGALYTRAVEDAYRAMWRRWCAGQPERRPG